MRGDEAYERQRQTLEKTLAARERQLEAAVAELASAASPGSLVARHPYRACLGAMALGVMIGWR